MSDGFTEKAREAEAAAREAAEAAKEIDPRQEWETPPDLWAAINDEFHPTIDVCATAANAKCFWYIGPQGEEEGRAELWGIDGLQTEWLQGDNQAAWCNPGFSNIRPWLQRAYEQTQAYKGVAVVAGLVSPSTFWWRDWGCKANEIRLLSPRVQWIPAPGIEAEGGNSRENCLFVFRPGPRPPMPMIWTWEWRTPRRRGRA